jgi:2-haloacid dehalogenase
VPSLPGVDVVLLDVNETLSDTSALAAAFERVGAPGALAQTWFASVLRDGFALVAAGTAAPFADVARATARSLLSGVVPHGHLADAADACVAAVARLPLHPDVPGGLRALRAAGLRVGTLTNGSVAVSEQLLERGGVRDEVERLLSVADAEGGSWKPAPAAYRYGLSQWGVEARRAVLVAVHPWDVDGAARAGLRTAWVDRSGAPYPEVFTAPDVTVAGLEELPGLLR